MSEVLSRSDDQRVVVVGMGGVTPVGSNMHESWEAIKSGQHGIKRVSETRLAQEVSPESGAKVVAPAIEVKVADDPFLYENRRKLRLNWWHASARLGFLAMYQALKDADLLDPRSIGLDKDKIDRFRAGFYLGSTFSGADQLGEIVGLSDDEINLGHLLRYLPARAATAPAMPLGLGGPGGLLAEECASGGSAIRLGVKEMNPYWGGLSDADVMVVGGTDAELSRYNLMLFGAAKGAVDPTDDPEQASRPFDKNRNGLVMGEASGVLVLETLSHAKSRGVTEDKVYAELVGFANLTDAANETRAGVEGTVKVIEQALKMAGVCLGETVYFNAHATSTSDGDPIEARAIQDAITNLSLNRHDFWVNSTKGATGHTMGAAGAIEAAFSIMALKENIVPPALKLHSPIEETNGLNLSPLTATRLPKIDVAVSTSFGFGGTAAALAFREYKP